MARYLSKLTALARIRASSPMLGIGLGLLIGQLSGQLFPCASLGLSLVLVLSQLISKAFRKRVAFIGLTSGFVLGVITMITALPQDLEGIESSLGSSKNTSYLAVIDGELRRRKVGAVQFGVTLLGAVPRKGELPLSPILRLRAPSIESGHNQARLLCRTVDLPWRAASKVTEGDHVVIRISYKAFNDLHNPFSYGATLLRHGYVGTCRISHLMVVQSGEMDVFAKFRFNIKRVIIDTIGNSESSGLLLALSIGVRDVISDRTENAFKRAGLAHVLVLSGYQITLCFALWRLLTIWVACLYPKVFLALPMRVISSLVGLFAALLLMVVAGIDSSSARAALALCCACLAQAVAGGHSLSNTMASAFVVLSLIFPGAWMEPGVQLTFAALFGLFLGGREGGVIWRYLKSCLYACLCTALVVMAWFGTFSIVGPVMNVIVAPVFSWMGCQGVFLAVALKAMRIDSAGYGIRLVSFLVNWMTEFTTQIAAFSLSSVSFDGPYRYLAMLGLLAVIVIISRREFRKFCLENSL